MRSGRGRQWQLQWQTMSIRVLLIGAFLIMLMLLIALRSGTSAGQGFEPQTACTASESVACAKLPVAVADALIHYVTTNITPQQTPGEINIAGAVLARRSPCNMLVFGLGYDSLMWATLNHGGRTLFLEEDKDWIAQIAQKHPELSVYHVFYPTALTQAPDLLVHGKSPPCHPSATLELKDSACRLALTNLPPEVLNTQWDAIMIDAPRGYFPEAPGRMTAIYTAAAMAKKRSNPGNTDIFVHDVDRPAEENFSNAFLCQENLVASEGRLWHFSVPAQPEESQDFCSAVAV
ncbi:hypothetical protein SUGI_0620120 [Cryptomeria japonica]|nr:hypothetical protein SUGI_0620120 [Cryptomeria japonica]